VTETVEDGRVARGRRTREAIIDALLAASSRKWKTGGFAAPRHSKTPTKARSQRAKPASPLALTARKTVIGSNAPRNAPPSPS